MSGKVFTAVVLIAVVVFAVGIGGFLVSAAADLVAMRASIV